MRAIRFLPVLILAFIVMGLFIVLYNEPVQAQGQNLLSNPSFEGQYSSYVPESALEQADCDLGVCTTAQTPSGWKPWWVKERPTDVNPEFKPAERNVGGNRVRTGDRAAQYFSFWSTHKAGLRQTVNVPPGSIVQFTIWGHSWLSESDNASISDFAGTPNMRIGIDPSGGTNPYSPGIVWSEFKQAFDSYQPFSVQAQALGDKVTVYTFSAPGVNPNSPDYGFKHTDIYWDDAALVVVGAGAAPPPPPPPADTGGEQPSTSPPAAAAPATQSGIGPTATPDADGVIYAQVQPGDSIWAVAARAGITLDDILEFNDLSRDDFVHTGDLLIVGFADPSSSETETEETSEEEVEEIDETEAEENETAEAEPTNTPEPQEEAEAALAPEEEESGVSICILAYDDANENGIQDTGEELKPAVAFTISDGQNVVSNYVTDGTSEPFCIQGLVAGSYRVTRSSLPDEVLTTPGDRAVSLTEGSSLDLVFGSYISEDSLTMINAEEELETPAVNEENPDETIEPTDGGSLSNIIIIGAIIVGILLVVLVILLFRRRSMA